MVTVDLESRPGGTKLFNGHAAAGNRDQPLKENSYYPYRVFDIVCLESTLFWLPGYIPARKYFGKLRPKRHEKGIISEKHEITFRPLHS